MSHTHACTHVHTHIWTCTQVAHRIGDVEEFELDVVDMSMGLPIVIGVPGWLNDSQDNAWKVRACVRACVRSHA